MRLVYEEVPFDSNVETHVKNFRAPDGYAFLITGVTLTCLRYEEEALPGQVLARIYDRQLTKTPDAQQVGLVPIAALGFIYGANATITHMPTQYSIYDIDHLSRYLSYELNNIQEDRPIDVIIAIYGEHEKMNRADRIYEYIKKATI